MKLLFTKETQTRRVFAVEAYPSHMRSHSDENGEIFGSHIHLGDPRDEQLIKMVLKGVDELSLERWIYRFRSHATVRDDDPKQLISPFAGELFS